METIGKSRIAGIGAYLPERRVSSEELMSEVNCQRFGIPIDYMTKHIGIAERRVADSDMLPSKLATLASQVAMKNSGITADEIDLIIFTGITKDCEEPSTAHFVQDALQARRAVCLDVSNACLGFMTGLSIADAYLRSEAVDCVLVCTGEMPTRLWSNGIPFLRGIKEKLDFKNKIGFLTAGDGGGACIVKRSDDDTVGLQSLKFVSRGEHARLCHYRNDHEGMEGEMLMKEISTEIVRLHGEYAASTYRRLGWEESTVDKIYCHQVGRKPHTILAKICGQPEAKAPITYDYYGNLTSATMPINMYLHPPERGDRVMLFGTGSGLTICQGGMIY